MTSSPVIKTLIFDGKPQFAEGLRAMLQSRPAIDVEAVRHTPSEVFADLSSEAYDLIVTGCRFGADDEMGSVQYIEKLRADFPTLKIVLMVDGNDVAFAKTMYGLGVDAIVVKFSIDSMHLVEIVNKVREGARHLDDTIMQEVLTDLTDNTRKSTQLSQREQEIMQLFAQGKRLKEIAYEVHRSIKTISTHKQRAMKKLGVTNDVDLVRKLSARGYGVA